MIVKIKTEHLQKSAYEILKGHLKDKTEIFKTRVKAFLFLLKEDNIDCVIMWAISWAAPKKTNTLQCLDIKKLLENANIFSLLNECGAVQLHA